MLVKEIKPIKSICFSTVTNLHGMMQYVRVKAVELYKDAAENNLEITGPIYWVYYGMDGNPATEFTLEVVLPVNSYKDYKGNFIGKTLEAFKCATTIHNGTWANMPESYSKLIGELMAEGKQMTGIGREVYINMDFENPDNNITELQLGIV